MNTFFLIVLGQIISLFGNAALRFALPLYLLRQTGSAALYGGITAYTAAEPVCRSRISGSTNRSAALPNSEMICPSTTCTNGPIVSSFLFHLQTVGL